MGTRLASGLRAISLTGAVYGLLVWLYVGIDIHIWPNTLSDHLGLATLFPLREDLSGEIAFLVSAVSFAIWRYLKH